MSTGNGGRLQARSVKDNLPRITLPLSPAAGAGERDPGAGGRCPEGDLSEKGGSRGEPPRAQGCGVSPLQLTLPCWALWGHPGRWWSHRGFPAVATHSAQDTQGGLTPRSPTRGGQARAGASDLKPRQPGCTAPVMHPCALPSNPPPPALLPTLQRALSWSSSERSPTLHRTRGRNTRKPGLTPGTDADTQPRCCRLLAVNSKGTGFRS